MSKLHQMVEKLKDALPGVLSVPAESVGPLESLDDCTHECRFTLSVEGVEYIVSVEVDK